MIIKRKKTFDQGKFQELQTQANGPTDGEKVHLYAPDLSIRWGHKSNNRQKNKKLRVTGLRLLGTAFSHDVGPILPLYNVLS